MGLFGIGKAKDGKPRISSADVKAKAQELILAAAQEAIPGQEKADKVIDQLVEYFDEHVDYDGVPGGKLLDMVDGPVLKFALGFFIKEVYEQLHAKGVLTFR